MPFSPPRFNDVHKQVCAALALTGKQAQEVRPKLMRWYARHYSANTMIMMLREELAPRLKLVVDNTTPTSAQAPCDTPS